MKEQHKTITGFSKLNKRGKIKWIVENFFKDPEKVMHELKSYWLQNEEHQKILDGISENTISNYHLPYGVVPNFVLNGETLAIPMVTEESSVVAAAASSAKFWMNRGGFKAEVLGTVKLGHVHFFWHGRKAVLQKQMPALKEYLLQETAENTRNMEARGGGILDIVLKDTTRILDGYYQLELSFNTCDSMGANFINSVLEKVAASIPLHFSTCEDFSGEEKDVEVLMSILSNYTPDCLVRAWVECPVNDLGDFRGEMNSATFADRFYKATQIARSDPFRAATHNKGIFNGIDAVVMATANDFRAIEAGGHCYASRGGSYTSLSDCTISDGIFRFCLEIPLSIGTVGGLTSLHPIARHSYELLGHPDAGQLMMIIASTGLAQNFAAVRSLITTGIQYGHMKMHLSNILHTLGANHEEELLVKKYFSAKVISFQAVSNYLDALRSLPINLAETDILAADGKKTERKVREKKAE